jgi:hypothetical protein
VSLQGRSGGTAAGSAVPRYRWRRRRSMSSACSASPPAPPRLAGAGEGAGRAAPSRTARAAGRGRRARRGLRRPARGAVAARPSPAPAPRPPGRARRLRNTSRRAGEILADGRLPLVLGGECNVTIAVMSAFLDRGMEPALLYGAALHGWRRGPVHPATNPTGILDSTNPGLRVRIPCPQRTSRNRQRHGVVRPVG